MFARRIAVIGAGYVGLTSAACLASLGHRVRCADIDALKVARLRRGEVGIQEAGLTELVAEGMAAGRLEFLASARAAVAPLSESYAEDMAAEVVLLCLPTPAAADGHADLTALEAVVTEIRDLLPGGCVVVNKSTVPVGTAARTKDLLGRRDIAVVSNPEFLREGSAVHDFLNPDRIVVGSDQQDAAERVGALYARLGAPILLTDAVSAEMVKYAANCFLAVKLSYVNALAELCERLGADMREVVDGMGYDHRIGQAFLNPGPGWGGSCLPKDTSALSRISAAVGFDFPMLDAALQTNARQGTRMVDKVRTAVGGSLRGKRIGLLGLTFKAGTDDLRDSPALTVAAGLLAEGAELTAFDPSCPEPVAGVTDGIRIAADATGAAKDAEAIVVLTEWPEFRALDWSVLAQVAARHIIVDTRNLLDPDTVRRAGFGWVGVGRR